MSIRVLVVDDYEPWRRFVSRMLLEEQEVQIIGEVSDGLEAVDEAKQLQPDLILLDIGLPTLNGIEVARRIRDLVPTARILFVSDNRSPDIAAEALNAGARGYLVKSDAASDLWAAVIAVLHGKRFVSRRFADHGFAATPDKSAVHEVGHVVHIYTDDMVLLDGVAALFCNSLAAGESIVAIMTSFHLSGLERFFVAQRIDVTEATKSGRLCILDADQTLNELMDERGPRREHFLVQFGNIVRRARAAAAEETKRVLVFGEMAALLWMQKKYDAAIRLEELWNELALNCAFYLCCPYPASAFRQRFTGGPYAKIWAQHSDVVSTFETMAPVGLADPNQ